MRAHHVRNATMLLEYAGERILIDPMFSPKGVFPPFKMFGGGRRKNPLVELPSSGMELMKSATCALITHEHPDHLDVPALEWLRSVQLPVWASSLDVESLRRRGLDARDIESGGFAAPRVRVVDAQHGYGVVAWLMGPVSGFYFAHEDEPSVYLTGDSVMTPSIRATIEQLEPDVIVAPAGSANAGIGRSILFELPELVELAQLAPRQIVFNHLESLDHCPTTRAGLREEMERAGVSSKVLIPSDGEALEFARPEGTTRPPLPPALGRVPGFRKSVTRRLSGT